MCNRNHHKNLEDYYPPHHAENILSDQIGFTLAQFGLHQINDAFFQLA